MTNFKAFLHKPIWKVLGIIFLIILVISLVTFSILFFNFSFLPNPKLQQQYWSAQDDAVEYQRKLWNQQKITQYNLGIKLGSFGGKCDWDLTVNHIGVVLPNKLQTIRGNCADYREMTIKGLFFQIEIMIIQKQCGRDGCECNGPRHMDVVYDETYHFPKSAQPAYHQSYRWMYKKTNIFGITSMGLLYDGPPCLMHIDADSFSWDVYKFVPIQSPRP